MRLKVDRGRGMQGDPLVVVVVELEDDLMGLDLNPSMQFLTSNQARNLAGHLTSMARKMDAERAN
jgi:hypothetical protein